MTCSQTLYLNTASGYVTCLFSTSKYVHKAKQIG